MKIDDAITMADLTIAFMRADAGIRQIKLDDATLQLIDTMETLAQFAKKARLKEMVDSIECNSVLKNMSKEVN